MDRPSATEKEDSYHTAMITFGEKSPVKKTMKDFVQEVATHVMANITTDDIPVFRVLGVGSGQGQTDLRILSGIATAMRLSLTKRPEIHSVIIEPNNTMMADICVIFTTASHKFGRRVVRMAFNDLREIH